MFENQGAKVNNRGDADASGAGHHRDAPHPSQADKATTRYKRCFYLLLVALLFCQFYYLAGSQIMKHWTTIEGEWQQLADSEDRTKQSFSHVSPVSGAAESGTTSPPPSSTELWNRLRRKATVEADSELAKLLLWPVFTAPQLNSGFYKDYEKDNMPKEKVDFMVTYMKLKSELGLALLILSGFILPFLYGLLGGFAFLLRKLSDPVAKLNVHDARISCALRLHIGALAGLAVGWFINGNSSNSGFGTLSPLALAFAAGYTSDLLFTALDKVTAAFSSPASSEASVKTGTTYGGMTVLTGSQRGARVASRSASAPIERPSVGLIGEGEANVSSVDQPRQRAA